MTEKIQLNTLAGCKWWDITTAASPLVTGAPSFELASDVYEETLAAFESLMRKDSEQSWLRKVASTGTHSDQVAALITLTQMSPVLSMHHLRQLLSLAQVKANRIVLPALVALKRLFVEELLPNRKLDFYAELAAKHTGPVTKTHTLLWFFEDFLKKTMATVVQILFDSQSSPIESIRTACVDIPFDLLGFVKGAAVTGEQEKPLLKLLVKAIGDKAEKRVSAKASLLVRKLALKRPHLKERIIDEIREQHLVFSKSDEYSRGISLGCSLLAGFPLNPQDDSFVAGKIVAVLSDLVNRIVQKKEKSEKKRKLVNTCGITEADARLLRLCLKAMETAFAAAGSECPIPETTNSLLIRLSHETTIPGLSVAILNFLNRLSVELKTDSPKLLRAMFAQAADIDTYLGNSLPWFLSLIKDSVLGDAFAKESTKIAFRRRLVQAACNVSEPGVLPVVLALTEPMQLEADLVKRKSMEDDDQEVSKYGYNPAFWDPVTANAESEPTMWERHLLRHHFDAAVRETANVMAVPVPEKERNLCEMLVEVSKMQLPGEKKRKKVSIEDAEIDLPGGSI